MSETIAVVYEEDDNHWCCSSLVLFDSAMISSNSVIRLFWGLEKQEIFLKRRRKIEVVLITNDWLYLSDRSKFPFEKIVNIVNPCILYDNGHLFYDPDVLQQMNKIWLKEKDNDLKLAKLYKKFVKKEF